MPSARALYQEGLSIGRIAKILSMPKTTVWRWIATFAEEKGKNMSARENDTKEYQDIDSEVSGKSGRPENAKTAACPSKPESESAEQKIARLEKELREARLRADFYDEMINVAEKKFDIQIRKKAGAKQ